MFIYIWIIIGFVYFLSLGLLSSSLSDLFLSLFFKSLEPALAFLESDFLSLSPLLLLFDDLLDSFDLLDLLDLLDPLDLLDLLDPLDLLDLFESESESLPPNNLSAIEFPTLEI